MAFFGPRLDRPSAVGTEGRPRATSLTIASVVVVGLFVLVGWQLGDPSLVLNVGTVVGFTVAGAALQTRERPVHRFVGHLCFLPFGTATVVLLLALTLLEALVIAGLVVAMVALGLTWANVGDREGLQETTTGTGLTYVSLFLWVIALAIVALAYQTVSSLVTDAAIVAEPLLAVVAFATVLAGTAAAIRLALSSLPILQLTPRDERDRVRTHIARYRRASAWVAVAAAVGAVLALLLAGYGGGAVPGGGRPFGGLLGAVGSPFVLGPLVVVGTVTLLAAAIARTVRLLTTHLDASTGRLVTALSAAGLFLALGSLLFLLAPALLGAAILSLALLLPLLLLFVVGALWLLVEFGVVPDRAGGPAVAAAGLFVSALGGGFVGLAPPVVFATVAGALLTWDVSTYGLGVTAELGHLPETRRLELFHGVLAVGVGALAVGGLWGVVVGRRVLRIVGGGPVAATVLVVAVVVLAAVLRG